MEDTEIGIGGKKGVGELRGMSVQSNGALYRDIGKGLYPNFFQSFLENISKGNRNDGKKGLIFEYLRTLTGNASTCDG